MRHGKTGRKFNRDTSHRRAMFKNLAGNLFLHERIETTDAKAKEIRRICERLITRATRLGDELTIDVGKLKEAERVRVVARVRENKGGGYTRIVKLNPRRGDNSPMAIIEILPAD